MMKMYYKAYVLIDKGTEHIESEVLRLMDPYGEHNELMIHEVRCRCVEFPFRQKLNEIVERDFGDPTILWKHRMEGKETCDGEAVWNEILLDLHKFEYAHSKSVLATCRPDPDCIECRGTGWITTTFDFGSRWNYWEWNSSSPFKKNVRTPWAEFEWEEMMEDQPQVYDLSDIDTDCIKIPAAILSPDGWRDFQIWRRYDSIPIPFELWEKMVRETLEKYKEDYLMIPVVCRVGW